MKKYLLIFGAICLAFPSFAAGSYRDVTGKYIKEPAFFPGWQGALTLVENGVGETYNGAFNLYQVLPDMPAGEYVLTADAFYRCGTNEYSKVNMKGGRKHYAFLYLGNGKVAVKGLFDGRDTAPNTTKEAAAAFARGEYVNTVTFSHPGGDLVLGIKNFGGHADEWCCFDNFQLKSGDTDYTQLIKNAQFDDGFDIPGTAWDMMNGDGSIKKPDYNKNGGVYRKTHASPYNFGQQIELPAGTYRFSALTFYRYGGSGNYDGKIITVKGQWGIIDSDPSPKQWFEQDSYAEDNYLDNAYLYVSFEEEKPNSIDISINVLDDNMRVTRIRDAWDICNGDYASMPENLPRGTANFTEIIPSYDIRNVVSEWCDLGSERESAAAFVNEPDKWRQYVEFTLDAPAKVWVGLGKDAVRPTQYWNPFADFKLEVWDPELTEDMLNYDGRFVTFRGYEDLGSIEYLFVENIDSQVFKPDWNNALIYNSMPIDLKTLGTIYYRLVFNDGTVQFPTYKDIEYYGTQGISMIARERLLRNCYEWNGGEIPSESFSVKGPMDASDFEWLKGKRNVIDLDLAEVTDAVITDGALASRRLRSIVLPTDLGNISGNAFVASDNLSALKWTSTNPIPAGTLDSLRNRNMLLYVAEASLAANVADHTHNLVVAGVADSLVLNHGYRFYCPEEFIARKAQHFRRFSKETGINGECAGWETIMLPFDVQTVEHEVKYNLMPFGVNPETELRRYWLYAPTTSGWERATAIRANEPYLIAMPNNGVYYEPFNVGGNVWFKATNAVVAVTPDEISRDFTGGRKLVGVYEGMASAEDRFGINQDTVVVGGVTYRPGSVFISQVDKGISPASPFEAYMLSGGESMIRPMEIFTSSEVEAVLADMEMKVWTENGGIRIQAGFTARVDVFDMTGRRVAVADVKAGEVCRVDGLAPGIYIVANRKVRLK